MHGWGPVYALSAKAAAIDPRGGASGGKRIVRCLLPQQAKFFDAVAFAQAHNGSACHNVAVANDKVRVMIPLVARRRGFMDRRKPRNAADCHGFAERLHERRAFVRPEFGGKRDHDFRDDPRVFPIGRFFGEQPRAGGMRCERHAGAEDGLSGAAPSDVTDMRRGGPFRMGTAADAFRIEAINCQA
ncbi:MAG: hypothetical protein P4M13_10675 [Alphaproteobacteria bacterium]|nr:hypothetical protein [Alphaproteobacteria bacterium]